MNNFLSILPVLVLGVIVLTVGILINRESKQTIESALMDSLIWGTAFFVSFGAEFLVLVNN